MQLAVVQGVHVGSDEGKLLPALTLRTTGPAIVHAGLASEDAVTRAVELLTEFAARPDSMLSGPRILQLRGRRPTTAFAPSDLAASNLTASNVTA